MTLLWEPQERLREVAEILIPGGEDGFQPCKVAQVPGMALLVFNNLRHRSIELSVYAWSPFWCTKQVRREIAYYVFVDNGCSRLEARTETDNVRAVRLLEAMDFQQEGTLRKASWNSKDMFLYALLREEVGFEYE